MADKEVSFTVMVKDAGSAALKQIEAAAGKVSERLLGLKDVLSAATGALGAFSVATIVKDMIDLGTAADATFRQIASSLPTAHEGMAQFKEDVESIATASGRSLEGIEASAALIARAGVSSAQDLTQQLDAAAKLADVTGASVDDAAQLLIQLRREFGLTGEQALDTAAKLAAAARGHVDVVELFSAFQSSAPIFEKFGIDVDTGTKAIVALVGAGFGIRQVRGEINKLDGSGIRDLAAQASVATNAMGDFETRLEGVRGGTARLNEGLKTEFSRGLEDLGLRILPSVNTALRGTVELLDLMKSGNWSAVIAGVIGKQSDLDEASGANRAPTHMTFTTARTLEQQGLKPPKLKLPESAADKEKDEAAANAAAQAKVEIDKLALADQQATDKANELARAQRSTLKAGIEQALGALTGGLAQAASQAIDDHIAQLAREVLLNESLTDAEKTRLLQQLDLTSKLEHVKSAGTPAMNRTSNDLQAAGSSGTDINASLTALMRDEVDLIALKRQIVALGGDDHDVQAKILEIEQKRAGLTGQLVKPAHDVADSARYQTQAIEEQARAIMDSVGGAIALGNALGIVSGHTADTLQSITQIAAGIKPLMNEIGNLGEANADGSPKATTASVFEVARPIVDGIINITGQQNTKTGQTIGGAVGGAVTGGEIGSMFGLEGKAIGSVVGGFAGLASGLLGLTHSASQTADALRKVRAGQDSVASSLAGWRAQITGTAADQKTAAIFQLRVQYDQIIETIESTEAGKKQEAQRNKDLTTAKQLYDLQSAAIKNNTALMLQNNDAINVVNGYKLALEQFQFLTPYGPTAPPTPRAPVAHSPGSPDGDNPATFNITVNTMLDGKIAAQNTVKILRGASQANYGTTGRPADAMEFL